MLQELERKLQTWLITIKQVIFSFNVSGMSGKEHFINEILLNKLVDVFEKLKINWVIALISLLCTL